MIAIITLESRFSRNERNEETSKERKNNEKLIRKTKHKSERKSCCDSALVERTKATENVLFCEWTIYIAQRCFLAVPFPKACAYDCDSEANAGVSVFVG